MVAVHGFVIVAVAVVVAVVMVVCFLIFIGWDRGEFWKISCFLVNQYFAFYGFVLAKVSAYCPLLILSTVLELCPVFALSV